MTPNNDPSVTRPREAAGRVMFTRPPVPGPLGPGRVGDMTEDGRTTHDRGRVTDTCRLAPPTTAPPPAPICVRCALVEHVARDFISAVREDADDRALDQLRARAAQLDTAPCAPGCEATNA